MEPKQTVKLVRYRCSRLNKLVTIREQYSEIPNIPETKRRYGLSCLASSMCIDSDCKMTGESKPKIYINANY